jgi:hypothetical protein
VGYLKGKSIIGFEKYTKVKLNGAYAYYVNTIGLTEAQVRKYILDQEINDSVENKYDRDLSNPF